MKSRSPSRQRSRRRRLGADRWWEEVLANFADALIVTDEAGQVVLFNQAAEELMGMPRARVIGQYCQEAFAGFEAALDMTRRVAETGQNESRSEEVFSRRDQNIPVRVDCLAIPDPGRGVRGTALIIHDLTRQRALEDTARRNESLARLGAVAAGLAHEIRNPLAGIKGAAQLLAKRLTNEPDAGEYTDVIVKEADRLSALVEELLGLGAPQLPQLTRLNIHQVVHHVLSLLEGELPRRGLRLACEFDPSLPEVIGDENRLSQVLLNLLKNAIDSVATDSTPEATTNEIVIRTRMETDYRVVNEQDGTTRFLRIEVADQGCGIPPADAERLFEPFFTTKDGGTGLGLAISHRIVADHGGMIRAEPNRPRGTCVTVLLPVAPPP